MIAEFSNGLRGAVRWFTAGHPRDPAIAAILGTGSRSTSGEDVTEDSALTLSAVWCAVNLMSFAMSCLPAMIYRRTGDESKERDRKHPLWRVLHDEPNPDMCAAVFYSTLQAQLLLGGNAFAQIQQRGSGQVAALWPLHPSRVRILYVEGKRKYYVRNDKYQYTEMPAARLLHFIGMTRDGYCGESVIQFARESFGVGLAADRYGGGFFGNSANPGGVIYHPFSMSSDAAKRLVESWNLAHRGPDSAGKVAVLEEGAKYEKISISPEDAQFLETRQFTTTEVARWFNIPPHKLKDLSRATFSNIEHQSIEFLTDTMLPWVKRWEGELNRKLFDNGEDEFVAFNLDGLLRADVASRYAAYQIGLLNGFLSPDEVRAKEDMNPIPGGAGSMYMRPANTVPAESADKPDDMEPMDEDEEDMDAMLAAGVLSDALRRMRTKETGAYARQLGKPTFGEWQDRFAHEHADVLRCATWPAMELAARLRRIDNCGPIVNALVGEHVGEMVRCGGDIAETPEQEAERWLKRLSATT